MVKKSDYRGRHPYHERALFVVAPSGKGKSHILRQMFNDLRFGTNGRVQNSHQQRARYWISNERNLILLTRSPHEDNLVNSLDDYFSRIEKMVWGGKRLDPLSWRWSFAGSLWPKTVKKKNKFIPSVADCVERYCQYFEPERCRVIFLSSAFNSEYQEFDSGQSIADVLNSLQSLNGVETQMIDVREYPAPKRNRERQNGLILADFFDFT